MVNPGEYRNGHSTKYGYGRVNADKAVAEAIRRRDRNTGTIPIPEIVEPNVASGKGLFKFSVERQASKGFGVQIGAFAQYGNVLIQAQQLQAKYKEDIIVNINELNGKTVYKVIVGAFNDKDKASRLLKKIKDNGGKGFVTNLKNLA